MCLKMSSKEILFSVFCKWYLGLNYSNILVLNVVFYSSSLLFFTLLLNGSAELWFGMVAAAWQGGL